MNLNLGLFSPIPALRPARGIEDRPDKTKLEGQTQIPYEICGDEVESLRDETSSALNFFGKNFSRASR